MKQGKLCCVWGANATTKTAAQRPRRKCGARKNRPLHSRRKTRREAPRARGKIFNYAGAKSCCAPTLETGISSLLELPRLLAPDLPSNSLSIIWLLCSQYNYLTLRQNIVISCHYLSVSELGNLRACCLP